MRFHLRPIAVAVACCLVSPALSGCVGIAVGAGAAVASTATEDRGLGGAADDAKLHFGIGHNWFQRDHVMFAKLEATVHDGRVLVTGVVQDPAVPPEAIRLVWEVPGVKEVFNEIEVIKSVNFIDYSRDVLIATQLRTRLMFEPKVAAVNYEVNVVNGTVYLIGSARSKEELDLAVTHARNLNYVKRVVSHIRIKDDPGRGPT